MLISNSSSGMATLLQQKNCMKTLINGGNGSNITSGGGQTSQTVAAATSSTSNIGIGSGTGTGTGIVSNGAIGNNNQQQQQQQTQQITRSLLPHEMVSIPIGSVISTGNAGINFGTSNTQSSFVVNSTGYQSQQSQQLTQQQQQQQQQQIIINTGSLSINFHSNNSGAVSMFSHNDSQQCSRLVVNTGSTTNATMPAIQKVATTTVAAAAAAAAAAATTTTATRYFSQFSNNQQQITTTNLLLTSSLTTTTATTTTTASAANAAGSSLTNFNSKIMNISGHNQRNGDLNNCNSSGGGGRINQFNSNYNPTGVKFKTENQFESSTTVLTSTSTVKTTTSSSSLSSSLTNVAFKSTTNHQNTTSRHRYGTSTLQQIKTEVEAAAIAAATATNNGNNLERKNDFYQNQNHQKSSLNGVPKTEIDNSIKEESNITDSTENIDTNATNTTKTKTTNTGANSNNSANATTTTTAAEDDTEPEAEPEIDIVINNVVCSFSVRCHLNLREIALNGFNVEFRRENGMVTMKLRRPYTTASIWSSGRITCTGATSEDQAKIAARRYARCLQKLGFKVRFNNFRVVNVLGTCSMPWAIKIVNFSERYKKEASYEPELHPGVTYKLRYPKATLKIFSTGSITVTAASVANVQAAIEHIFPLVYEFRKKRTQEQLENLRLKQLHQQQQQEQQQNLVKNNLNNEEDIIDLIHSPPQQKSSTLTTANLTATTITTTTATTTTSTSNSVNKFIDIKKQQLLTSSSSKLFTAKNKRKRKLIDDDDDDVDDVENEIEDDDVNDDNDNIVADDDEEEEDVYYIVDRNDLDGSDVDENSSNIDGGDIIMISDYDDPEDLIEGPDDHADDDVNDDDDDDDDDDDL